MASTEVKNTKNFRREVGKYTPQRVGAVTYHHGLGEDVGKWVGSVLLCIGFIRIRKLRLGRTLEVRYGSKTRPNTGEHTRNRWPEGVVVRNQNDRKIRSS